jgi:hypothetical protein
MLEESTMKLTFRTERLDVFKIHCQRDEGYTSTDVYLGFHREGKTVYPCFHNVVCTTVDVKCVAWIETLHGEGRGFASELLQGIVEHEKLKEPLYPDVAISERAARLFAKHEKWFADHTGKPLARPTRK